MTDPVEALEELAEDVATARANGTVDSARAVQLKVAEPILEVLGWDVRSDEVQPARSLDGYDFDYVLAIDDVEAVAVVTVDPDASLDTTVEERLRPVLDQAAVARGMATDGEALRLLLREDRTVHERTVPIASLADATDALEQFHRSVVEAALDVDRSTGAARRLAANEEAVVAEITESVVRVTGSEVRQRVERESERAVASMIDALADGPPQPSAQMVDEGEEERNAANDTPESTPDPSTSGAADGQNHPRDRVTGPPESGTTDDVTEPGTASDRSTNEAGTDGDQFVARFFGGSSSVGAVGTETPRGTTVGAVRYLLENQDLANAITFPWSPSAGSPVLAKRDTSNEWVPLESPSAGPVYVRPIDDSATARATIEALAEAVGLRVMFQGDW